MLTLAYNITIMSDDRDIPKSVVSELSGDSPFFDRDSS
jgi:hypothetical protein